MADRGRILQLNVSPGGVPKRPVPSAWVSRLGLEGDAHRHPEHHGGPERALCVFPWEAIQALAAEGHAIAPGAIGENVTTEGLDWSLVVPGVHLLLDELVLVQVTRYTRPCTTIAPVFRARDFGRVSHKRHPGCSRVYARVLAEGRLRVGDAIRLVEEQEAEHLLRRLPATE